jgi:hypothetical protein
MKWRLLVDVAAASCGILAAGMVLLFVLTWFHAVGCFWSVPGTRYDVMIQRGVVHVNQLHEYRFDTPFRWTVEKLEKWHSPPPVHKSSPWWHGDNSWWEGIGYTVRDRHRMCGFEYATGRYWPPFSWQHPKMPFTVYQVPMWAIIVPFTLVPLVRLADRSRESSAAVRAARKAAESGVQAGA